MASNKHRAPPTSAISLIAALALFLVSLVPVGAMPTQGEHGIEMVLCTGNGPVTRVVVPTGDDADHADQTCHWSLHFHTATLPLHAPTIARTAYAQRIEPLFQTLIWQGRDVATHNAARAPPAIL